MRPSYPVRTVQLGLVPALVRSAKLAFPQTSTSLWQRDAKRAHRRIMDSAPALTQDDRISRQAAAVYTIAALFLAFHESAPADVDLTEGAFARMVADALAAPIVAILLSGDNPFKDENALKLNGYLCSDAAEDALAWDGAVEAQGDPAFGDGALGVTVTRCGLRAMCIAEKRLYLLRHLCMVEEALAAACSCDLDRPACIALGDRACSMVLTPATKRR